MAINIKSPGDFPKGKSPYANPGGVTNGEPGYQKRSDTRSGVPEVTYDPATANPMAIQSPQDTPISMPRK